MECNLKQHFKEYWLAYAYITYIIIGLGVLIYLKSITPDRYFNEMQYILLKK